MGFKCGIVGLPNVGKSTLFNALTATAAAQAQNYPFCTIEPNVGKVSVPDQRLEQIARIAGSAQIIPTQLEFVDIAGLVRGASQGEGLGNRFLGHIRETDAIIHVVRCFEDIEITHVDGDVDPLRDIETIETELMLADLENTEKRLSNLEKKVKQGKDPELLLQHHILMRAWELLKEGKPARDLEVSAEQERAFRNLQLITAQPVLYVCNVREPEARTGNTHTKRVTEYAYQNKAQSLLISAQIEADLAALDSTDRLEYLHQMGLAETGLSRVIREGYQLLDLLTFFTVGPKEARAWTVPQGATAPEAAGVIHTDFERGFICAETISFQDYVSCQGEQGAKASGKVRLEGKGYHVQDADIFHFRFNV